MITTSSHVFADKQMRKGDEYEATSDEADIVEALGWSKRKPLEKIEPKEQSKEESVIADAAPDAPRQKRQYRRRDMTAQKAAS